MIATSTLTRKRQTTLPKAVVTALGVKPSQRLVYEIEDDHVILKARTGRLVDLAKAPLYGTKARRAFSAQEMRRAAQEAAVESVARNLRKGSSK